MVLYISFIVLWAVIFIITLIHEIQSFNLTTIWFCISAFVSLILAILDVHIAIQVGVFIVLSVALLLATKPLVKKFTNKPITRTNVDRIIGEVAIVTKGFGKNEMGEVVISGNYWRALCHEGLTYEVNEEVIIKDIEGNKVVVSKIEEEKENEI